MKTDIIPYQKMTAEAILYKENDPLLRYAIYKAYNVHTQVNFFMITHPCILIILYHRILPLKYFRKKYGNII